MSERPTTCPSGHPIDWIAEAVSTSWGICICGQWAARAVNGMTLESLSEGHLNGRLLAALRNELAAREAAERRAKDLRDALGEICEIAFEGTGERGKRILAIIDRVDPIPTIPSTDALEPTP